MNTIYNEQYEEGNNENRGKGHVADEIKEKRNERLLGPYRRIVLKKPEKRPTHRLEIT